MFQSTKVLELGSCAFRQPHASHSHCKFLHGYKLSAKFWFEAKELDTNNWVVDFGGLKDFKKILRDQFDHTTCIAADDPAVPIFQQLVEVDACNLKIMPDGTGVEKIAEWCYKAANKFIPGRTNNRCRCVKVEVFEHEDNSAIYTAIRPHFSSVRVEEPKASAELYSPATKEAVTQSQPATDPGPKDLTKPPFKKDVDERFNEEGPGSVAGCDCVTASFVAGEYSSALALGSSTLTEEK
jgi:6-pyruvoyltetrahydropterin/6-carboxytetrahydropterin synthase